MFLIHSRRNFVCTVLMLCLYLANDLTAQSAFPQPTSMVSPENCLKSLVRAYPDVLSHLTADSLYWRNGVVTTLGSITLPQNTSNLSTQAFEEFLNTATLRDQVAQCYPRNDSTKDGVNIYAPPRNYDPGRIRYEPFFRTMYGATESEVSKNLVPVRWLEHIPEAAQTLLVTRINGVNARLQAVSEELERLPQEYRTYLAQPAGTFKWRTIAGTERQSNHSFGAAIDIAIKFSDYWRWDMNAEDRYPHKNRIPLAIVRVFEKHGFIWGGAWYHYDTMHFEYRPELLTTECACGGK